MTRVAHLTSVHGPGDTRIFRKECVTLAEAGYDVTLVVPAPSSAVEDGVNVDAVAEPEGRLQRMATTVRAVRRRALELDADLYHLHDPELLPLGLELRRRGKPVVYDAHEDVPRDILSKDWLPPSTRRFVAAGADFVEGRCAQRVSAVVAATETIAERMRQLNPRTVTVNNYPVLGALSAPPGKTVRREQAVCYVGDINAIRGAVEMVDAAAAANVRLLLGGTFSETGLRERVATRPGWSHVEELGRLSKEEVAATFARSRAGLVLLHPAPNHINGRPNKLFEYMSAELPVIASDFVLWRTFVEDVGCGLCVDPLDTDAIAAAIRRLVDDPEEAAEMGRRGREAVASRFNWEQESGALLDLYRALAPVPGRDTPGEPEPNRSIQSVKTSSDQS
jgi:glycosyltransferase involved in cell wall biosynthesis